MASLRLGPLRGAFTRGWKRATAVGSVVAMMAGIVSGTGGLRWYGTHASQLPAWALVAIGSGALALLVLGGLPVMSSQEQDPQQRPRVPRIRLSNNVHIGSETAILTGPNVDLVVDGDGFINNRRDIVIRDEDGEEN